jgi:diketogulonate reductase-like aldo/keto reductase
MTPEYLGRLMAKTSVVPALNQIEVHPYFKQADALAANARHGIVSQAWSPIGGITFYRDSRASTLDDPVINRIAQAHGKTPAQVMLRWNLQQGRSAVPKSVKPARIAENLDVFDFELTPVDLEQIDALDTNVRGGMDPNAITLSTFSLTEIQRREPSGTLND